METFALDTKAHPYFDEVADDIIALLKTGASLQEAYDKAVWANPVIVNSLAPVPSVATVTPLPLTAISFASTGS